MSDTRDVQSVVSAAEAAAAGGDYVTAELRLREAARLQEDQFGPVHPDLANTLNNLGIVNEILEKPAEAEASFRRAVAIATASLPPDHPFVLTSRKNLEDFCVARGIAIEVPTVPPDMPQEPPAVSEKPAASGAGAPAPVPMAPEANPVPPPKPKAGSGSVPGPRQTPKAKPGSPLRPGSAAAATPASASGPPAQSVRGSAAPAPPKPATPAAAAPALSAGPPRTEGDPAAASHRRSAVTIGALLLVALTVAIFALRGCPDPDAGAAANDGPAAQPTPSPSTAPPPAPAPRSDDPSSVAPASRDAQRPAAALASAKAPAAPPAPAPFPAARGRDAAPRGTAPRTVDVRLCRQLTTAGEWPCTALPDPAGPGRVFYYTRLTSPRNTSVEHRWYRGDLLVQAVKLSIGANANEGYRTFSRQTIESRSAGNWRVELRTIDGSVLHEQRFVVK